MHVELVTFHRLDPREVTDIALKVARKLGVDVKLRVDGMALHTLISTREDRLVLAERVRVMFEQARKPGAGR